MGEAGGGLFYPDSPEDEVRMLSEEPGGYLTREKLREVMDQVWAQSLPDDRDWESAR